MKRVTRGRYLEVMTATGRIMRPNKVAAGAMETLERRRYQRGRRMSSELSDDARTLAVRGTLDNLRGLSYYTQKEPCPNCKCKCNGQLVLNDAGRARLRQARERRAYRLAA